MAEWCVSGSDSDEEKGRRDTSAPEDTVELGGLKIPPSRLLELMKQVDKSRTLELSCLSEFHRKRQGKKKTKRHKHPKIHSPAGSTFKSVEEVSETASEVRSTTSTTATDYRESRRTNMIRFDPLYDPELDDQPITIESRHNRGKKPPPKPQPAKLASLDKIIEANARRKQKMVQETQTNPTLPTQSLVSPPYDPINTTSNRTTTASSLHTSTLHNNGVSPSDDGFSNGGGLSELRDVPSFRFDEDEDSDNMEEPASELDMKFSLLSQINRVEKLLDSEGLS